jgi:antitoxin component of RelBE/YafQ-DinJ toxin-antitoxin module
MDTVIFKIDKKLKERAQKQAKKGGFSLSDYYRSVTIPLAEGKSGVGFVQEEQLNAKTQRELRQILKEIRQEKGLSPAFDNAEDAINYLKNL